ncbi:hypothetical protein O7606_05865 [Micromonospora sp. WMMD882]|uniref:hypothetical protein n=1 Tax=Micromonospora sp. WMMD882 TaxID=3015151 RepID=UPI00248B6D2D|nr:hypothetical protein [Micromonospora sp. WMMD882]WBB80910.1 hypothetical protein O7606_05865 [Micromonospora sp. WMMD882]
MIDATYQWPPAGQAWLDLPEPVRAGMVAAGAGNWAEIFHGRATYNKQWRLARPPVLTAESYRMLNAVSLRLAELLLDAARRRAGTTGELATVLGVDPVGTRMLPTDEPLDERLLAAVRPDVLLSDGVPRVVEFNIDSSIGGVLDADTVVERFTRVYAERGILDAGALRPAPSAMDTRFAAIRATLGLPEGAVVPLLLDFDADYPGLDDPDLMRRVLAPVTERAARFGLVMPIEAVTSVGVAADGGPLVAGRPVDGVFRLFVLNRVTRGPGLDALESLVLSGLLPAFTSGAAWLLGNKQLLAWLWSDLDTLDEADRAIVRRHLPRTELLTADLLDRAVAGRHDLVAKPADGSAGVDVVIGRETDAQGWAQALRRGVDRGGHILQEYAHADVVPMDFVHIETGETVTEEVPYSIAPYLFGRQPANACVRSGFPGCEGVLNLARGVLLSGIFLVD